MRVWSTTREFSSPVIAAWWEARWFAQRDYFNLYLLDTKFPDDSGFELCRWLKKYSPNVPAIIYSHDALKSDVENGFDAGANLYLIKPYLDDLAKIVLETVEGSKKPVRIAVVA